MIVVDLSCFGSHLTTHAADPFSGARFLDFWRLGSLNFLSSFDLEKGRLMHALAH